MKLSLGQIGWVIAVILLTIIFFMDTCRKPCPECPEVTIDTVTLVVNYHDTIYTPIHDTVYNTDTISYPEYIYIPEDIDSLQVAMAFFTKYKVEDVILDDTNGYVKITDEIWMNKIQNRKVEKRFYPHIYTITKTIIPEVKMQYFIGGAIGGSMNSFEAWVDIVVVNKKKRAYTASYGFLGKQVKVGLLFNL